MAGEWVKIRVSLDSDPAVVHAARWLLANTKELPLHLFPKLTEAEAHKAVASISITVVTAIVTNALRKIWGLAQERGKRVTDSTDVTVKFCGLTMLDDIGGLPGIGAALREVEWVREVAGPVPSVVFRNLLKFISLSGERTVGTGPKDKTGALRQRRHRARKSQLIVTSIIERDGERCGICGEACNRDEAVLDHITPINLGGNNKLQNKQLAHESCNGNKCASRTRIWRHPTMPDVTVNGHSVTGDRYSALDKRRVEKSIIRAPGAGPAPFDLADVDWGKVIGFAEAVAKRIPPRKDQDRRDWLRYAILATTAFDENWLIDSAEAVVNATKPTRRTPQARFVGVLKSKAAERGNDLDDMRKRIEIPSHVWEMEIVKVQHGTRSKNT